jgi:hypothetical protein
MLYHASISSLHWLDAIGGTPVLESYNVSNSTLHKIGAAAA